MIFVLTIGSLCWSSSWWWQPHISGSEIFGPLLRAGLANLDQFFLQNVNFVYVGKLWTKFGGFSRCFCPFSWPFSRGGALFQNWGAGADSQFSKMEGPSPTLREWAAQGPWALLRLTAPQFRRGPLDLEKSDSTPKKPPILREYLATLVALLRLVTFETLITFLTIENLNSWQSLLPDN